MTAKPPERASRGFLIGTGDWTQYRKLGRVDEIDCHLGPQRDRDGWRQTSFHELMDGVREEALEALQLAQEAGYQWVLFTHGRSSSRPGKATCRSVIRKLMRSKSATPFIVRCKCIQHESVFVAAIRPTAPPARGASA